MTTIYVIESIDHLGKDTLIQGIKNKLGFFQVIHLGKPELLDAYSYDKRFFDYQYNSFQNAMEMFYGNPDVRLIFNRSWIGDFVYGPLYRGYSADYVFELEKDYWLQDLSYVKLILLTEDFSVSKHFKDDGLSLGPITKRQEEQNLFIQAFNRSVIKNKKLICVTDKNTGEFRRKKDILEEALS